MYRRRRMTDGILKLNETARTSRSYTEMTSTLPWHQSVTAFCQLTILRGSYDALRSSVCSTGDLELDSARRSVAVSTIRGTVVHRGTGRYDRGTMNGLKDLRALAALALVTVAAITSACA